MIPASRDQLITYALRQLGAPVIAIDVAQEQLEDRVDEALLFFLNYSKEGTVERLYKHAVTASTVSISATVGTFVDGEILQGNTSGTRAKIYDVTNSTTLKTVYESGEFTASETLTGIVSGATCTFDSIVKGDIDNQYASIDPAVISISQMLPIGSNTRSLFDVRYQMAIAYLSNIGDMDLIDYDLKMRHISLINDMFSAVPAIDYSRISNRLDIKWNWNTVKPGDFLVFRTLQTVNPTDFPKIYGDMFLIELTTELIKRQWGNNLKKFGNVQLLNGVVLNGDKIYEEADQKIKELKEFAQKSFQLPTPFFCG